MRINCHVVVHARENKVEKQHSLFDNISQPVSPSANRGESSYAESYKVYVTAPPEDGKANKKVIEVLSEYFKVAKSQVRIIKGEISRNKIVEIEGI